MNPFLPPPTGAEIEIRRRIETSGPITFAEFMGVALHWPHGGYYATRQALGPTGDFFTAPLTHPVFGALIARHIDEMWRHAGSPSDWLSAEIGAGNGRLAADVVETIERERLGVPSRYLAIDASERAGGGVQWVRSIGVPLRNVTGVLLANELFDALPVHRLTMRDGELREMFVGVGNDGRFVDVLRAPTAGVAEQLDELGVRLTDGHVAEVCLETRRWLADAAAAIDRGFLLLIDYGHEANAYYDPSRGRGTLRTYYQHTLGMDPYRNVGRQDISVHVEFSSVRNAALAAGFDDAGAASQADFLRNLGFDAYRRAIEARADVSEALRITNAHAMDMLVDPDGMGAFRVVAFSKGVDIKPLTGFAGGDAPAPVVAPLATTDHMPLANIAPTQADMPTWDDLLR